MMGWYAVREALVNGRGPYGSVKQSLRGETSPTDTLREAICYHIDPAIKDGKLKLDRAARSRVAYWRRWARC